MIATLHARRQPVQAGALMLGVGAAVILARPGVGLIAVPAMIAGTLFILAARSAELRPHPGRRGRPRLIAR